MTNPSHATPSSAPASAASANPATTPRKAKEAPEESVAGEEDPGAALDLPVVRPKEEAGVPGKPRLPDPGPGV